MQHSEIKPGYIVSHYKIQKKIGEGGYGSVYSVIDLESNKKFAMKIEYLNAKKKAITNEIRILYSLRGSPYFPNLIDDGVHKDFRYYIMDLFGPSLHRISERYSSGKLPLSRALILCLEMLHALEALHEKGFVHRDVKPSNFLLSGGSSNDSVALVDFGLSERYTDWKNEIRPYAYHTGFAGTETYASPNVHRGIRYAPRDDLLSWFYSLVEIANGELPWNKSMSKKRIQMAKMFTPSVKMCHGMPLELDQIYLYLKNLKYERKPNYRLLERLLKSAIGKVEKKTI